MSVYQGGRGIAFEGGNSMFSQLSAAQQRLQEARQIDRENKFYDKMNASGLLGAQSEDFFKGDTITEDGNIKLKDTKSWKSHYNNLVKPMSGRQLRKTFGSNVSRTDMEQFFKAKSAERDMNVITAIERKMQEKGTSSIYKVVPKKNETGGKEFEDWYNNITDDAVRKRIRDLGYQPGQQELAFTPDFVEKKLAQGKSLAGYGGALAGAGYLGAIGAREGARVYGQSIRGAYRDQLKGKEGEKLRDLKGTNKRIAEQQKALSDERAKLKKQLKDPKLSKRNAGAINKRIAEIDKEKKALVSDKGKFKRSGQGKISKERARLKKEFAEGRNKGILGRGKSIGGNIVGGIGGQKLGGAIGEAVGGDSGRVVGEIGGGLGLPALIARYGPSALRALGVQGMTKPTPWTVGLGIASYGVGSLLDAVLND